MTASMLKTQVVLESEYLYLPPTHGKESKPEAEEALLQGGFRGS